MELAERAGPSLDWWLTQPFAFALWTYRQLQEWDRRRQFAARMERIELAGLMSLAFHEPKKLQEERERVISEASSREPMGDRESLVAHWAPLLAARRKAPAPTADGVIRGA